MRQIPKSRWTALPELRARQAAGLQHPIPVHRRHGEIEQCQIYFCVNRGGSDRAESGIKRTIVERKDISVRAVRPWWPRSRLRRVLSGGRHTHAIEEFSDVMEREGEIPIEGQPPLEI
jgi:hypothetical protein